MISARIRAYMKSRGRASVEELAAHFDCQPSAIEGIMETLAARGLVALLACGGCGGANGCAFAGPRVYVATGTLQTGCGGERRQFPASGELFKTP